MQAYGIRTANGQMVVELMDRAAPVLSPTQMRIQMHAASLNRGEFISGHGLHSSSTTALPVGMEGAGTVIEIGNQVQKFAIGDRVMGRCPGAFASQAVMEEREAMPIPKTLSWYEAAAVPLTFLTAYDAVCEQGQIKSSEWVLINGVTSGVGVAALQIATALGAYVIGTSGSSEKLIKLQEHGLRHALDTRANFFESVMQLAPQGVNLAVNTVGGSVFAQEIDCLGFQGRLAMVGYVDGKLQACIDLQALHAKRLRLFGVSNKLRNPIQKAASIPGFMRDIWPLIDIGLIRPLVDQIYPFASLAQAKEHMLANKHVGKVVLSIA